jgi:hypothetical protein
MAVDRDYQRPHEFARPDGPVVGGGEHTPALEYILRVGTPLP